MKHEHIQNELFDYCGQASLPAHLAKHVEDCPACRNIWHELQGLSVRTGDDELFYPAENEIPQLAAQIDTAISNNEQAQPEGWRTFISYLIPIAASLLLLFGIARIGSHFQQQDETQQIENTMYSQSDNTDSEELDENTISLLLEEFSAYNEISSSEFLLDDLSDEEMEYLVKNMDIGELL